MKRIFYIYSEATMACLMGLSALVEFVSGFFIPEGLNTVAFSAAGLFTLCALQQIFVIVKAEKQ